MKEKIRELEGLAASHKRDRDALHKSELLMPAINESAQDAIIMMDAQRQPLDHSGPDLAINTTFIEPGNAVDYNLIVAPGDFGFGGRQRRLPQGSCHS